MWVSGLGHRVYRGLAYRVWACGFRVSGLGFRSRGLDEFYETFSEGTLSLGGVSV